MKHSEPAPQLDDIRSEVLKRFRAAVAADESAEAFPELLSMEEQLSTWVQRLGLELLRVFVEQRLEQVQRHKPTCPNCDEPMQWHKLSRWKRGTALGSLEVADIYAYCRRCHHSQRPLHQWLGTARERWSLAAEQTALDLASDESCQRAADKLERHHPGVSVGRTSVLRMLHKHGAQMREFVQSKLNRASAQASQEGNSATTLSELEVEYDGGMIPVGELESRCVQPGEAVERTRVRGLTKRKRHQSWQEAKLGLVQVPGEVSRLYSARPTNELDGAFSDLFALACLKGWTEQTQVRGIADGARHIRERMQETFHACPFQFILDRPHAREHLSEAAEALAEHTGIEAKPWADAAMERIDAGAVMAVVEQLRQAHQSHPDDRLRLNAEYFERNRDAVSYAEYRAKGWSQASSEVESAHRHVVQQRMKIPGAWWRPENVSGVLALRVLKANGWWDEYWSEQRRAWKQRAQSLRVVPRLSDPLATAA